MRRVRGHTHTPMLSVLSGGWVSNRIPVATTINARQWTNIRINSVHVLGYRVLYPVYHVYRVSCVLCVSNWIGQCDSDNGNGNGSWIKKCFEFPANDSFNSPGLTVKVSCCRGYNITKSLWHHSLFVRNITFNEISFRIYFMLDEQIDIDKWYFILCNMNEMHLFSFCPLPMNN